MSLTIARQALEFDRVHAGNKEDWRYLGAGVSRQVYQHIPTGIAYKVPSQYSPNHSFVNYHEAAVSAWFRENFKMPGVIWPDFIVHDVDGTWVSEVTFFENDNTVARPVMDRVAKFLTDMGISDACPEINIFSCKGFVVPIDLGYHGLCGVSPWDPNYWVERWEKQREWDEDNELSRVGIAHLLRPEFIECLEGRRKARLAGWQPCRCSMCIGEPEIKLTTY